MEVKSILDSVIKLRKEIQDKRTARNSSRSVSPSVFDVLLTKPKNLQEPYEGDSDILPKCRQEMVKKYQLNKCPLPRVKKNCKAYKIDACELISLCFKKILVKVFNEIKFCNTKYKKYSNKPPIDRRTRSRPGSKSNFSDFFNTADRGIAFKSSPNKILKPATKLFNLLQILIKSYKKSIFSSFITYTNSSKSLSQSSKISLLVANLSFLLIKAKKKVFENLKNFVSEPFGSAITTPKFIVNSSNLISILMPGKIVRTNPLRNSFTTEIPSSEEPERNPTFGPESEESVSIDSLKVQNSIRKLEIERSLAELEKSNTTQRQEINRSKRLSLSSINKSDSCSSFDNNLDHFISRSAQKPSFTYKLPNKSNDSMIEVFNNEENDMSLKSFNQMTHNSSFDKEISIIKNFSDSFESKKSSYPKSNTPLKNKRSNSSIFKRETPSASSRRLLIKRLEALSKLEDTMTVCFHELFLFIIKRIKTISNLNCQDKLKKIVAGLYKKVINHIINSQHVSVYAKSIKGLISCLNCNFLYCKERTLRKWQMKVRLEIIRKKEIYLGVSSMIEILKKHVFTRNYFFFNLLKKINKRLEIQEISILATNKTFSNILTGVLNNKKRFAWSQIKKFSLNRKKFSKFGFLGKVYWKSWKKLAFFKGNQGKVIGLNEIVEVIKKKYFPGLWQAWKALKGLKKNEVKIQQRILMKKFIEGWIEFSEQKSCFWIQCFYNWKQTLTKSKMEKLKDYKNFFL